jgi:hypothetical protein
MTHAVGHAVKDDQGAATHKPLGPRRHQRHVFSIRLGRDELAWRASAAEPVPPLRLNWPIRCKRLVSVRRGKRLAPPPSQRGALCEEPNLVGESDVVALGPVLGDAPVLDAVDVDCFELERSPRRRLPMNSPVWVPDVIRRTATRSPEPNASLTS